MRESRIEFPWWLRGFIERVIRRRLQDLDAKVPITFYFQVGQVKGRVVVDDLLK